MSDHFPNMAGKICDIELQAELTKAGIHTKKLPECLRETVGEVKSIIIGTLHGWSFERSWRYWVAKGPGIPPDDAETLHAGFGQEVRVDGHCGCPSPKEWFKGFAVGLYHVDTHEGLAALANTIKTIFDRNNGASNGT